MAGPAVGEAVVASAAGGTGAPDDVGLAGALASEGVALQLGRAHEVAHAGQGAAVVLRRDREHGVAAESCTNGKRFTIKFIICIHYSAGKVGETRRWHD